MHTSDNVDRFVSTKASYSSSKIEVFRKICPVNAINRLIRQQDLFMPNLYLNPRICARLSVERCTCEVTENTCADADAIFATSKIDQNPRNYT